MLSVYYESVNEGLNVPKALSESSEALTAIRKFSIIQESVTKVNVKSFTKFLNFSEVILLIHKYRFSFRDLRTKLSCFASVLVIKVIYL